LSVGCFRWLTIRRGHYNWAAPWNYPDEDDEDGFRASDASIVEQWEVKRLANRDAAGIWRLDEIKKLYESCGRTADEIGD